MFSTYLQQIMTHKIGIMISSKQPPAGQNKDYYHACFKFISIILLWILPKDQAALSLKRYTKRDGNAFVGNI